MALTKEVVEIIHEDIRAALEAVLVKHNLKMGNNTRITYNEATFKFAADFSSKDEIGDISPKYYEDLRRHGWKFKLDVKDIGTKFTSKNVEYEIVGMRGYTYVVAKNSSGAMYKFRGDYIQKALNR